MAVTANDVNRGKKDMPRPQDRAPWAVNAISADWSGNEIVKADPGSGAALYIEYIEITCVSAISLVLNADTTAFLGPFYFGTGSAPLVLDLRNNPIQMTANTALQMDGSGSGNAQIYVEGFTVS
jgi:hypothetical protein